MRRSSAFTVIAASACLVLASCGGSAGRSGHGPVRYAANGTFTMAVKYDLGTFDPYHSQLIFSYAALAYDTLVNLRPDGKIVSGLAEKWSASPNEASFTLRPGITCSDGTPLTASQVAADLNYVGNPKNQSKVYGVTIPTTPYAVTADDTARTIKVTMKKPFGFLLNTIGLTSIVCAKGLKNPAMLRTESDGTGPFVLTNVAPGQSYTFTTRKDYTWGPDGATTKAPGTPAKVVLKVITNETTATNLMLAGQLNLAEISGQDRHRLTARHTDKIDHRTSAAWLWFNQISGRPTADRNVRQALVRAIDRDQIIKVSTNGSGRASTGLIALQPAPCPGDTVAGQFPAHDLALAQNLLDQAGWGKGQNGVRTKGGKPLTLDLHYTSASLAAAPATAELIAQQWRTLGAQVKLSNDTVADLIRVMYQTSNYDVYISGFSSDLPSELVPDISGPIPPKGTNIAGIHNQQYETLVAKAQTMTPPESCTYWNQAEQSLYHDFDPVPISNTSNPFFLNNAQAQLAGFTLPIPMSIRVLK
jgi:peptide/nickel transport system substrate-binding protein